jgi:hypothetical protein
MRNGYRFAVLALIAGFSSFFSSAAFAQGGFSTHTFGGATIHGTPPSVTSIGFGGHPGFHGIPPSVTSLNFGNVPGRRNFGFRGDRLGRDGFRRRHHRRDDFISPFLGGYYLPYGYDYGYDDPGYYADSGVDDSADPSYYGSGPTIFDRNGAGRLPGPPPGYDYRADLNPPPRNDAAPVADQPETVLVFKDGHEQEVKNYAIVGATLYDLSDGRTRKVQLAELDLTATVKQNDDRGIAFQLPAGSKLN